MQHVILTHNQGDAHPSLAVTAGAHTTVIEHVLAVASHTDLVCAVHPDGLTCIELEGDNLKVVVKYTMPWPDVPTACTVYNGHLLVATKSSGLTYCDLLDPAGTMELLVGSGAFAGCCPIAVLDGTAVGFCPTKSSLAHSPLHPLLYGDTHHSSVGTVPLPIECGGVLLMHSHDHVISVIGAQGSARWTPGAEALDGITTKYMTGASVAASSTGTATVPLIAKEGHITYVNLTTGEEKGSTATASMNAASGVCCVVGVAPKVDEAMTECAICFDDMHPDDSITLDCGHRYHTQCIDYCLDTSLTYRRDGTHISFNLAKCSMCSTLLRHPKLERTVEIMECRRLILLDARTRYIADHPDEDHVPGEAALEQLKMYFYECHRCRRPFFGGSHSCAEGMGEEPKKDPASLVCTACKTEDHCRVHGDEALLYKCAYCCNPAVALRYGTLRVCDRCVRAKNKTSVPCGGVASCPLSAQHDLGTAVVGCLACGIPHLNLDLVGYGDGE
eukprot:PhM_4_TR13985/c0_g1_i1/m.81702